jgi:hypothetical protein
MKLLSFLIIVFVYPIQIGFCQSSQKESSAKESGIEVIKNKFLIIPQVGIAVSKTTWKPDPAGDITDVKGLSIGATFEYKIKSKFSYRVGLLYIQKGQKLDSHELLNSHEISVYNDRYKFNYVEMPLSVREYLSFNRVQLFIEAGVYTAYGVGGIYNGEFGIYDINSGYAYAYTKSDGKIIFGKPQPSTYNGSDRYYERRTDYGYHFAAGFILYNRISIEATYDFGLVNFHDADTPMKNRSFQVLLGVPFSLVKRD